jgi:hypothetical protein
MNEPLVTVGYLVFADDWAIVSGTVKLHGLVTF